MTRRRHVWAVAVEYIGKEANRWEEQFYLGEVPEAQIEYGLSKHMWRPLLRVFRRAVTKHGVVAVADEAELSRQQLASILAGGADARPATIRGIVHAIQALENRALEAGSDSESIARMLKDRIEQSSLSETAHKLNVDPSNLRKALDGKRQFPSKLRNRLEPDS